MSKSNPLLHPETNPHPLSPLRVRDPLPPADTMVLKFDDLVLEENVDPQQEITASILPPKPMPPIIGQQEPMTPPQPLPPLDFEDTQKIQLSPDIGLSSPSGIDAIRGRHHRQQESTDPMLLPSGSSSPHSTMELRMDDLIEEEQVASSENTKEQWNPLQNEIHPSFARSSVNTPDIAIIELEPVLPEPEPEPVLLEPLFLGESPIPLHLPTHHKTSSLGKKDDDVLVTLNDLVELDQEPPQTPRSSQVHTAPLSPPPLPIPSTSAASSPSSPTTAEESSPIPTGEMLVEPLDLSLSPEHPKKSSSETLSPASTHVAPVVHTFSAPQEPILTTPTDTFTHTTPSSQLPPPPLPNYLIVAALVIGLLFVLSALFFLL